MLEDQYKMPQTERLHKLREKHLNYGAVLSVLNSPQFMVEVTLQQ